MKRFKAMAISLALVVGASGAALAQPRQQNNAWQEAHRTVNLPEQNYKSAPYGDRDGRSIIAEGRRADRDDVRTQGYGRYGNDEVRERGHDNDDAWQYAGQNNRHRVMGPEVRVRQYGSAHAQSRVDADRDRF